MDVPSVSTGGVFEPSCDVVRTASAPCPAKAGPFLVLGPPCPSMRGSHNKIVNRVVRSTRVPITELPNPRIRSPSQWPGTWLGFEPGFTHREALPAGMNRSTPRPR